MDGYKTKTKRWLYCIAIVFYSVGFIYAMNRILMTISTDLIVDQNESSDMRTKIFQEMQFSEILERLALEGHDRQKNISKAVEVILAGTLTKREIKDDLINATIEHERCQRYGYSLMKDNKRRRVFLVVSLLMIHGKLYPFWP